MSPVALKEGIYYVGSRDWNRRQFDALVAIPQGTSYNAYLVVGNNKAALIDSVAPGFEQELIGRIESIMPLDRIDYFVMNHAEPDHAGAIPMLMERNQRARLLATKKGASMAMDFYGIAESRIDVVDESTTVELGGRTLGFIGAPYLHWPETMFTYLKEEGILFPCDFFGAHTAFGIYGDELEDALYHAKKYFGEIMMPFRTMAKRALNKVESISPTLIAPGHGPIYRDCAPILDAYRGWCEGRTRQKVTIIYVSMWHSTERMVGLLVEKLQQLGVQTALYNLAYSDIGDVAMELVDSRAIVVGTPVVLGGMHPLALYGTYVVKALRPPARYCAILGSYGWGGGAVKEAERMLASLKLQVVGTVETKGPPAEETTQQVIDVAIRLASAVKDKD